MFTHEITSLIHRPLPRFVAHSTDLHRGVTWHLTMQVASMLLYRFSIHTGTTDSWNSWPVLLEFGMWWILY